MFSFLLKHCTMPAAANPPHPLCLISLSIKYEGLVEASKLCSEQWTTVKLFLFYWCHFPRGTWGSPTIELHRHAIKISSSGEKWRLWRVDSKALYPAQVSALSRLHSQISTTFPNWIWHPYLPSPLPEARGELATLFCFLSFPLSPAPNIKK